MVKTTSNLKIFKGLIPFCIGQYQKLTFSNFRPKGCVCLSFSCSESEIICIGIFFGKLSILVISTHG